MKEALSQILEPHNQEHLIKFWGELTEKQKNNLAEQIKNINFDEIDRLTKDYVLKNPEQHIPDDLCPPDYFSLKPKGSEQKKFYKKAVRKGMALLKQSKVAAFTVAGGQGSRLGFDGPKGTFPITPVKKKTLFQYFAEVIKSNSRRYDSVIPWYIMTSTLNNEQTQDFFEENNYFGLKKNNVIFFVQGTMPAIGYDGRIVLDGKDSIALAPNGHGGSLLALKTSGALDDMKRRKIKHISYFQVDNPLVSIINPLFIGLHSLNCAEMSAIMLEKTGPFEKLGNFCKSDGKLMIIEYSDLPDRLAEKRNDNGKLAFIAGSPAIHIIKRKFVERLTTAGTLSLPWHRADKKVPSVDETGNKITPEEPNAVKLETFIFDALPLADKTVILEAKREDEFAPTKNKTGVDSVESCRKMLAKRDAKWLENSDAIKMPRNKAGELDCIVELSRESYLDMEDIKESDNQFKTPKKGEEVYYE
jgi:UDP-N-acetylglucosamine/UDP-N-acetylgalactosamine diphosphorylase